MHPLYGPRLKLSRAKIEIDRLRLQQDIFRHETDYSVIKTEVDPDTGNDVYHLKIIGPPPSPEWSISIGEITHNLRCALNHIIFQLALLNNSPEIVTGNTRLQFPIYRNEDEFGKYGRGRVNLLKPIHQTLVERLQPYQSESGNYPLIWLNEINNADKHRLIQIVGAKAAADPIVMWWGKDRPIDDIPVFFNTFTILEDGAKIIAPTPTDVSVGEKILPSVAFWQGCEAVKGRGVIVTLNQIATCVSDIVESFASEF